MCYVTIMSPDFAYIWFIEFSYLVLKLIIGSAQSQPQGLKNVFNRVESYSAGLFTYKSTYDNKLIHKIVMDLRSVIRDPQPKFTRVSCMTMGFSGNGALRKNAA